MWARYMEGLSPAEAAWWVAQEDDDDTMAREVDMSLLPVTHEFIPLGFEGGGAFGEATLNFLQQVQDTAGGMTLHRQGSVREHRSRGEVDLAAS
eukprot:SAG31_NODE_153_length_22196_cov_24.963570_3_plen_94_part_00